MPTLQSNTQQNLDNTQYAVESIEHYELIFGRDFVSPGGEALSLQLIERMQLSPDNLVLDMGCGLGGSAFLMARKLGLQVEGIDLSENMIRQAVERCHEYALNDRVKFYQGNCLGIEKTDRYDAIYSRDVFLHIENKAQLFDVIYRVIKPGGQLLFSDYCCGNRPWQDSFSHYVSQRGYHLCTVERYRDLLLKAGFSVTQAIDETELFLHTLREELKKIVNLSLPEATRFELSNSWKAKISRAEAGDHRWGVFSAIKTTTNM
ncbi:MAG: methyltransferase domain-containing protein [Granulosicoccus sp.]